MTLDDPRAYDALRAERQRQEQEAETLAQVAYAAWRFEMWTCGYGSYRQIDWMVRQGQLTPGMIPDGPPDLDAPTFECAWCKLAELSPEEYTRPIWDLAGTDADTGEPICHGCADIGEPV